MILIKILSGVRLAIKTNKNALSYTTNYFLSLSSPEMKKKARTNKFDEIQVPGHLSIMELSDSTEYKLP